MTFKSKLLTPLFLLTLFSANTAIALPEDRNQPIELEANQAKLNNETGIAEYTGNVIITQGTAKLEADRVILYSVNNEVTRMKAFGEPAKYQQILKLGEQPTHIEGKVLDLKVAEEIAEVTGNGVVYKDKDRLSAEKIIYSLKTGELNAKKNQNGSQDTTDRPIKMIFYPPKKEETPQQESNK